LKENLVLGISDEEMDKLAKEVYSVYCEVRDRAIDKFVKDIVDNRIDIENCDIAWMAVSYIVTEYIDYSDNLDRNIDRLLGFIIGRLTSGHELNVKPSTTVLELRGFAIAECTTFLAKSINRLKEIGDMKGGGENV